MGSDVVRNARRALVGTLVIALALVLGPMPATQALAGDVGHRGPSFAGVANPPTAEKPQSKLWFNDGAWWAVMYHAVAGWQLHRLDRGSDTWVSTGVAVDDRKQTLADALWSDGRLYVASHWVTTSSPGAVRPAVAKPARLYRYSYSDVQDTYVLDAGFPATISAMSTEAMTIDADTTGRLWATWTQVTGSSTTGYDSRVYVASSANGADWTAPAQLGVEGTQVAPDDISAVVAFGRSSIGVLWSNQLDDTVYWAVHRDGQPLDQWRGSQAVRGTKRSDDHISLKTIQTDDQGRVWAVVKTSLDGLVDAPKSSAQVELLQFKPGTGSWTSSIVGTLADCHTRPIVVLDEENEIVHVFATAPTSTSCPYSGAPGTIYLKSAPMADPQFQPGRGIPVIRDTSSAYLNNATSTKQTVTSATGIVVLASDEATGLYWHADLAVPRRATSPPTIRRTATSTAEVTTAAAGIELAVPPGTRQGDLLVACLALNGSSVASTGVPPGWTQLVGVPGISNPRLYGFMRVAGAAEPSSYRWAYTKAVVSSGGVAVYERAVGLDTTVSSASGAASRTPSVPGVVTQTDGAMLVGCLALNSGTTTVAIQEPTRTSKAWDLGAKRQAYADAVQATAGASGGWEWQVSASREWAGWLTALRPRP